MKLSLSEQATNDFYQWEYLGRGHYLFQTPVDIEPPYTPFSLVSQSIPVVDDGRIPSIFSRLANLFVAKQKEEIKELQIQPKYLDVKEVPILVGISISFSSSYEILPSVAISFLNVLSYSHHNISFEICGTFENIRIQILAPYFLEQESMDWGLFLPIKN